MINKKSLNISSVLLYVIESLGLFMLFFSLFLLLNRDTWVLFCKVQLVALLVMIVANFLRNRSLSLYIMWISGYIFIVWSEQAIISESFRSFSDYYTPLLRFSLSNAIVLLSYHLFFFKQTVGHYRTIDTIGQKRIIFLLLVLFSVVAIVFRLPDVYVNYFEGRQLGSAKGGTINIVRSLSKIFSIVMPATIAWYYKKYTSHPWWSLLLVIPVIAISILSTTRFRMLYAILPYLILMGLIPTKKIKNWQVIIILSVVLASVILSSYVKRTRMLTLEERETMELVDNRYEENGGLSELAGYMSPEGVIKMAYYADQYFEFHPLHKGRESGFMFYFWIPRAIWHNKPTQLDYWLIREYKSVSDSFSSASGFIGELRADFGWGLLLFMVIFGILLKKGDNYVSQVIGGKSHHSVIAASLYPFVFFAIRSPLTSFYQLFNILLILFVLSRFMTKQYNND